MSGAVRRIAVLAALLTFGLAAQARANNVTGLGALIPMGLNSSDQVVGDVLDGSGNDHAALWSSGSLQMLGQLSTGDQSDAYAISAGGRIAGDDYSTTSSVDGVYWNGAGAANQVGPFDGVDPSSDFTVLNDVDAAGDLAGFTPLSSTDPSSTGLLFQGASEVEVGQSDLGGQPGGTVVGGITPAGSLMLGSVTTGSGTNYYLWSSASPSGPGTALSITPPRNDAVGLDGAEFGTEINNDLASDGTVLGYTGSRSSGANFIRLPNGTVTPVSGLFHANAVNASHIVAGDIITGSPAAQHAASWSTGTVTDLNTLLPANSGWVLIDALAINDRGDIVGIGEFNGQEAGFLLAGGRPSATNVACSSILSSSTAGPTGMLNCTATVTDTSGQNPPEVPTGTVSFAASAGSFATPSCTVAGGALFVACSDTYTPAPAGTSRGAVTITASYGGDANFNPSQGTLSLCSNGQLLELDSVSPNGPHSDGFRIGSQVVLHGCGFQTGMRLIWGAGDPTGEQIDDPAAISADGTTATVTVPWGAVTGTVTVADNGSDATLDGQAVDSWRNTEGLSFQNYGGYTNRQQFANAFATPVTTGQASANGQPILLPRYETFYSARNNPDGFCYGFAYLTGQQANLGSPLLAGVDPYHLDSKSAEQSTIQSDWWKQFSDENQAILMGENYQSAAQVRAALGSDPWNSPSIVSLFWSQTTTDPLGHHVTADYGHAVAGFAVQDTSASSPPGDFTIYTYNSNDPYAAGEESLGVDHAQALQRSNVAFAGDGTWSFPEFSIAGFGARFVKIEPISQLAGHLHLLQAAGVTGTVGGSTSVMSASGPTGAPVDLAPGTSGGVTVLPDTDSTNKSASPRNPGVSGISEILGPEGRWREILADQSGPVSADWYTPSLAATIQASQGQDAVDFDSTDNTLAVAPATGAAPSSAGTIQLISGDAGQTERVLSVTGPVARAHAVITLAGNRATLATTTRGVFQIVLSTEGPHTPGQSFETAPITLTAGQKLTLSPASWPSLQTTTVAATLTSAGDHRRARLHNHLHITGARVLAVKLHGKTLAVTLALGHLDVQTTAIQLTVAVSHGGRTILTKNVPVLLAAATNHTIRIRLVKTTPAGASARITVQTRTGGITPTVRTTSSTIKLHG